MRGFLSIMQRSRLFIQSATVTTAAAATWGYGNAHEHTSLIRAAIAARVLSVDQTKLAV
jgi:hypothetical protein